MKKATTAETVARTNRVLDLIIQGAQRKDILSFCKAEYNLSTRQSDVYLQRATELLREEASKERKDNLALSIARYNLLFAKNFKVQDFRECRNIQQALDKLLSLADATMGAEEVKETKVSIMRLAK